MLRVLRDACLVNLLEAHLADRRSRRGLELLIEVDLRLAEGRVRRHRVHHAEVAAALTRRADNWLSGVLAVSGRRGKLVVPGQVLVIHGVRLLHMVLHAGLVALRLDHFLKTT